MSYDAFRTAEAGLESPATRLGEITPSDTQDLPWSTRAIAVATAGWAVARFPREAPKVAVLKPGTRGEWRSVGLFPRSVAKAIIAAGLADCVLHGARLVALRINAAGRARLDYERASRAARRGVAA